MSEGPELKHQEEEAYKLIFEIFKHLTTLNIATTVVILTIYRDLTVDIYLLVIALLCFCISLVLSFFGMNSITYITRYPEHKHTWRGEKLIGLMYLAGPVYLGGMITFALSAIGVL